jgi:Ca2+-binding EF-hand superfamily protein
MLRQAVVIGALLVAPSVASAQQPCTTDARRVVDEVYRHVLERASDRGADMWVDRLSNGTTVREVVRDIAKSPEHLQRWGNESRESVVGTMYRHVLNRQPDSQALRNGVEVMARRGPTAIVDQIVDSPEYRQAYGDWRVPGNSGVNYCPSGAQGSLSQNGQRYGNGMRFRRLDTNNDGQISRSEWRGNANSFRNFDWNNDGVLSGDEVAVRGERQGLGRNDEGEIANDSRFDYLDVNGNGFIEPNEWDGGANAFTRLDTSRDRRLSRSEFDSMSRTSNGFQSIDMNGDGRIMLNEWPWTHRSFDQQDSNGDGAITREEFRGNVATPRN